jgi:hypothetical protein
MLRKTGRYPHLSNATEKHLSGPPRAGLKGIRIEVCIIGSVCATTHAAEGEEAQVTLLATSVTASTFDFSRSWTHIDKLVRRDKVLYDVCRRVFNAHTSLLIPGRVV